MKSNLLCLLFLFLSYGAFAQNKLVQLFYDMDVHTLTSKQKLLLKQTLDSINNGNNYYFNITGYTDYVASEDYNMKLAKKRADIIKNFIQSKYPQLINTINTSAHGELVSKETLVAHNAKKGDLENRRVDVVIMFAQKTGYIPLNKNEFMGKPYVNLKPGDSIELKNLHFVLNTTNLEEESQMILDTLVQELKNHKSVHIKIEGHVCCGDVYTYYRDTFKQKQMQLSKDRAKAVFNYLVLNGIKESRLSYKGYGFKKPKVYPEKTEEDKAANRRVIVKITYL